MKRTFCDANQEIRNLLSDIISEVELAIKYEDVSSLYEVTRDLNSISDIVEETQDYVDRMENRLKDYKYAIESLGFIRGEYK